MRARVTPARPWLELGASSAINPSKTPKSMDTEFKGRKFAATSDSKSCTCFTIIHTKCPVRA